MKKEKIILDVIMTILMILLMNIAPLGLLLHEIIGISILFIILFHNLLNLKFIKSMINNFKKLKIKTKVMFIVDIILTVQILLVVFTGIVISKKLLPGLINIDMNISDLHHLIAYTLLFNIGIHIGLHWTMIMNAFKKMLKIEKENKIRKTVLRLVAFLLAVLGIYSISKDPVKSHITRPFEKTKERLKTENGNNTIFQYENVDDKNLVMAEVKYIDNLSFNSITENIETISDTMSLDEYLSKLVCNGCPKHCPLNALGCRKGEQYKTDAVEDYNEIYAQDEVLNEETVTELAETEAILESNISSTETLEEYLGNLFCDGCPKHCSLANLGCSKGEIYREEAIANYNKTSILETEVLAETESKIEEENKVTTTEVYDNNIVSDEELDKYLGTLICTGCPNHCPLNVLQCEKGEIYKEEAMLNYKSQSEKQKIEMIETAEATKNNNEPKESNLFEAFAILSLFIAGTHYTIKLLGKFSSKNKH